MYQGESAHEIGGWDGIGKEDSGQPDVTKKDISPSGESNKRVLVVDDDDGIREMLSKVFYIMGYEAVPAHSGSEALNMFLKGPFALVMTDLQMPGMDGWSLASHIKERSPEMPVLLMTAQARERVMKELEGSSIDSALFKPFSLEELRNEVQRVLKDRSQ